MYFFLPVLEYLHINERYRIFKRVCTAWNQFQHPKVHLPLLEFERHISYKEIKTNDLNSNVLYTYQGITLHISKCKSQMWLFDHDSKEVILIQTFYPEPLIEHLCAINAKGVFLVCERFELFHFSLTGQFLNHLNLDEFYSPVVEHLKVSTSFVFIVFSNGVLGVVSASPSTLHFIYIRYFPNMCLKKCLFFFQDHYFLFFESEKIHLFTLSEMKKVKSLQLKGVIPKKVWIDNKRLHILQDNTITILTL